LNVINYLEEDVLKNYLLSASLAVVASSTLVGAQSGASQQPPARPAESQDTAKSATTTLTGCVYQEKDIPGRAPNPAERAGVLEDYILVLAAPASPSSTPGATGTAGASHKLFKLEKIDDEKLRAVVGKRVEVTGRIDAEAGDARTAKSAPAGDVDKAIGRDKINIAEFEVASLKEVSGTCPAKPGSGQ
jgi:hypothetical protein